MLLCATHAAAAHPQTAALHAKATVIQGRGKKSRAIATAAAAAAYEEELQQPATLPFFSCFSWQAVNLALRPLPKVKGQQHLQHRLRHTPGRHPYLHVPPLAAARQPPLHSMTFYFSHYSSMNFLQPENQALRKETTLSSLI